MADEASHEVNLVTFGRRKARVCRIGDVQWKSVDSHFQHRLAAMDSRRGEATQVCCGQALLKPDAPFHVNRRVVYISPRAPRMSRMRANFHQRRVAAQFVPNVARPAVNERAVA